MTELSVFQEAQMREHGSADFRQTLKGLLKMATILDGLAYMEAIARRSHVLRNWLAFLEMVTAAAEEVPGELLEQFKPSGRLVGSSAGDP
jgi:hypothetical protein